MLFRSEILDARSATFVPAADASAIAAAIVAQLAAPNDARERARRACAAILPFDVTAIAERYLATYDRVRVERDAKGTIRGS